MMFKGILFVVTMFVFADQAAASTKFINCNGCSDWSQKNVARKIMKKSGDKLLIFNTSTKNLNKWGLTYNTGGSGEEGEGGDYDSYKVVKLSLNSSDIALRESAKSMLIAENDLAAVLNHKSGNTYDVEVTMGPHGPYDSVTSHALANSTTASGAVFQLLQESNFAAWQNFQSQVDNFQQKKESSINITLSASDLGSAGATYTYGPGLKQFEVKISYADGSKAVFRVNIAAVQSTLGLEKVFEVVSGTDANGNPLAVNANTLSNVQGRTYYGDDVDVFALAGIIENNGGIVERFCRDLAPRLTCGTKTVKQDGKWVHVPNCELSSGENC